jgi:hypothetical protein
MHFSKELELKHKSQNRLKRKIGKPPPKLPSPAAQLPLLRARPKPGVAPAAQPGAAYFPPSPWVGQLAPSRSSGPARPRIPHSRHARRWLRHCCCRPSGAHLSSPSPKLPPSLSPLPPPPRTSLSPSRDLSLPPLSDALAAPRRRSPLLLPR